MSAPRRERPPPSPPPAPPPSPASPPTRLDPATEVLADAAGFVLGALGGWFLGQAFGFDFVRTPGYGVSAMVGLVFIVAGCGVGRWSARRAAMALMARR